MSIDAAIWRDEREQRLALKLAWDTAVLTRTKHVPRLSYLLSRRKTKPLRGDELRKRREEFDNMTQNIDLKAINAAVLNNLSKIKKVNTRD